MTREGIPRENEETSTAPVSPLTPSFSRESQSGQRQPKCGDSTFPRLREGQKTPSTLFGRTNHRILEFVCSTCPSHSQRLGFPRLIRAMTRSATCASRKVVPSLIHRSDCLPSFFIPSESFRSQPQPAVPERSAAEAPVSGIHRLVAPELSQ